MKTKENTLTIVLPTCDDYSGVMMTTAHLIMDRRFNELDYDILVVDNTPEESKRKHLLKNLPMDTGRVSYIELPESRGPAHTKNTGVRAASGKYVLCMDCHVFLHDAALTKLYNFLNNLEGADQDNIFSGPLLYKGTYNGTVSTNFNKVWRGHMWGTWETKKDLLSDDTPKEIDGQGCGLFLVKKDSWLGFCDDYLGFGGEEMVIHEKYRRNGRKAMLLPWLGWWHRFGDPNPKQPVNFTYLRVRNYVVGFQEIGMDIKPIYDHFVNTHVEDGQLERVLVEEHSYTIDQVHGKDYNTLMGMLRAKKIPLSSWQRIIDDPKGSYDLPNMKKKPTKTTQKVDENTPKEEFKKTDLVEALIRYTKDEKCPVAKEIGFIAGMVRETKAETIAEITYLSQTGVALATDEAAKKVTSHLYFNTHAEGVFNTNERIIEGSLETDYSTRLEFEGAVESFLKGEDVDLLLLKLPPMMEDTSESVLKKVAKKVKKAILIHDTSTEDFSQYSDGLKDFSKTTDWDCKFIMSKVHNPSTKETIDTDGLTLMTKDVELESIQFAWPWEKAGAGTELKKMLAKIGFGVSEDCKCTRHARVMDEKGTDWCEANIDLICSWLMEESEKKGWGATVAAKLAAPKLVKRAIKIYKKKLLKEKKEITNE